jgi:hypothetical protein
VAKRDDLLVEGAAGGPHNLLEHNFFIAFHPCPLTLAGGHAVDPVVLHRLGGDPVAHHVPEEGDQVDVEPHRVHGEVFGAAFALGEDAIFGLEDGSSVLERGALGQFPGAVLDLEIEVPIRGDLIGALKLLFLGRDAVIAAGQVGGALPEGAAIPAVNVESAASTISPLGHRALRRALLLAFWTRFVHSFTNPGTG